MPPKDMAGYEHKEWEWESDGDFGAKRENLLSAEGERAMGFKRFEVEADGLSEGQREMRRMANERLGFALGETIVHYVGKEEASDQARYFL
ncbi:uncharacterized protein AB675_4940 [Cyphellophora attinorum]|uniref:Uncharacterized protein n=1 Tax=Cyphellophora attinorum TaxID=1664694 RepID=A0A0N0NHI4_9EURO|nr:uncharacterized protein AB675_4940 [Phialophora attinorum]KPI34598.1 hypothetical protein AB675_4940 [Phialophora attinorum]